MQYLPIGMPGIEEMRVPTALQWVNPLLEYLVTGPDEYIYLTVKHLHVDGGFSGNRPGWHSDGFMTRDTNLIWSNLNPTEFCIQPFKLTPDDQLSLTEMAEQADEANILTYPNNTLLLLDESVIHRPAPRGEAGYRAFVKLSVSKDRYNLLGNAHNPLFDYQWDMVPRQSYRNPTAA